MLGRDDRLAALINALYAEISIQLFLDAKSTVLLPVSEKVFWNGRGCISKGITRYLGRPSKNRSGVSKYKRSVYIACVHFRANANYKDQSNTDKSLALFLCDTVIPSNEGLGFEEEGNTQSTRFFGDSNNYKFSLIHKWLLDHKTGSGDLVRVNVGIRNEYAGSTERGGYENLDSSSLARFARKNPQVLYTDLFIPSMEEALAMKEYLWKFYGSDTDNGVEAVDGYCGSYWLRTPKYQTTDMVYTVNLRTGAIEPRYVNAVEGNQVCDVGIRPMYVVEQAY